MNPLNLKKLLRRKKKLNKHKTIPIRQCISCRNQKARDLLVCLKKVFNPSKDSYEIIVEPNNHQFGRSAYICKDNNCINTAIKGKKIQKMLRVSTKETLSFDSLQGGLAYAS